MRLLRFHADVMMMPGGINGYSDDISVAAIKPPPGVRVDLLLTVASLLFQEPLNPGLWNLVVEIRSSSHDPCLTNNPATCSQDDTVGHITVPLDFLLYLYPPLHMCAGDCKPSATGAPTCCSLAWMHCSKCHAIMTLVARCKQKHSCYWN